MRSGPLIILGAGYTGRHLYALAKATGLHVLASSREPARHLTDAAPADRIEFALTRRETWKNILLHDANLLWCFPAQPLDQVQAFAQALTAPPRRMIVLGSTSAYDVPNQSNEYPPPWLDEAAPFDLTKPRVQGEEYLRQQHGAIVLRVAGIYGPGRNPLDWIRQGRVGPSRKYVNLIHVEDLAEICLLTLERGRPGEVYNVSDGTPRTWREICEEAQRRCRVVYSATTEDWRAGKRIATTTLRDQLGNVIRHPDLYAELENLERGRR